MTARADAKDLSGGRSFMRITVNGKKITSERLVNKNLNFTYGDGFKTTYWSTNMSAWYLFFSPDFVGYDNPKLADHILRGQCVCVQVRRIRYREQGRSQRCRC